MEFLGVGPAELAVILVVALVFVGPERLPKLAADIARTIREIRKYTSSLAEEFNEVVKDFEKDTEGERSAWKEIGDGLTGATKSMTEAVRTARADAQGGGVVVPPNGSPALAATPGGDSGWREIPEPPAPLIDRRAADPSIVRCPSCASGVAEGQRFCGSCGASVPSASLVATRE